MLNIAIVEDELLTALFLKDTLEKYNCQLVGIATNLTEARQLLSKSIDLFMLDIRLASDEIGNEDGLLFASELNVRRIPFIFITGNTEDETTLKAAKTQPLGYLTKPFNTKDILASISIIRAKLEQCNNFLSISGTFGKKTISVDDVYYVEANGAYVTVYCKAVKYTQRITLKKLLENLNNAQLVRIHRSYAVHSKYVTEVSASQVLCVDKILPVSSLYKENLKLLRKAVGTN